jgi:23S rRNA-intervening sequence protein
MPSSQGFRDLRVYQLAFKLAMEIYEESKKFPREELYSLNRSNSPRLTQPAR